MKRARTNREHVVAFFLLGLLRQQQWIHTHPNVKNNNKTQAATGTAAKNTTA